MRSHLAHPRRARFFDLRLTAALVLAGAALAACRGGQSGDLDDHDPPIACKPSGALALDPADMPRQMYCAIDVGSRNVKLIVASTANGDPMSFRNERQCRSRLQLADRTTDKATGAAKPLRASDEDALIALLEAYRKRCTADNGKLLGVVATEWARRVPNAGEVQAASEQRAQVKFEVLARDEEARFGYMAATRGERGKLVLDFGSRSMQLSFWPKYASAPSVIGLPLGIDAVGDRFFAAPGTSSYAAGQTALKQALRAELEPFISKVRDARGRGEVGGQLYSLGENGDLALALEGRLWLGTIPRAVGEDAYADAVKEFKPTRDPQRGLVAAVFTPQQLAGPTRLYEQHAPLFEDLRSAKLKRVYGNKMLVYPALIALLEAELDLDEVVLVPQEMADGVILERMGGQAASARR